MTFEIQVDGANSVAVFRYEPDANYIGTLVYVFNRDRGVGVIETAHADGSVGPTRPVSAVAGEQFVVTFERDDQTVSTCIRIRDGVQNATDYCTP